MHLAIRRRTYPIELEKKFHHVSRKPMRQSQKKTLFLSIDQFREREDRKTLIYNESHVRTALLAHKNWLFNVPLPGISQRFTPAVPQHIRIPSSRLELFFQALNINVPHVVRSLRRL